MLTVQDRSHHGNSEKALKIAVLVPIKHCDGVSRFYSERGKA